MGRSMAEMGFERIATHGTCIAYRQLCSSTRNDTTRRMRVGADGCAVSGRGGGAAVERRSGTAPASASPGFAALRSSKRPSTSACLSTNLASSIALSPTSQNACDSDTGPRRVEVSGIVPVPDPDCSDPGTAERGGVVCSAALILT